jgi:hypothetical protein
MITSFTIGLTVLLFLSPALSQEGTVRESSQILKKLDEISQRLSRIEQDIKQIRITLRRLEGDRRGPQEGPRVSPGRDPKEIWQAMGNPIELAKRLEMLVRVVAPTIRDEGKREEFKKDVDALKEKIGRDVSEEELYEKVRQRLSERLEKTTNEREKAWLKRQLDALEESEGEARKEMVDRFVRIQNIRALHDLARKYSIEREHMVRCGLAFVGYRRGPPGEPRHPEVERRPGRRPRGAPGAPKEKSRR